MFISLPRKGRRYGPSVLVLADGYEPALGELIVHKDRGKPKPGAGRELLFRGPGQREFLADLQRFFAQPAVNGTLEFPYGVQEALARRSALAQAGPRRPPARRTHEQNVVALAGCVSQLQQSASWNDGLF